MPVPRTCEYVALHDTRDFVYVKKKLWILRKGDFPGLSSWTQSDKKGSYGREARVSESEIKRCYPTVFEGRERDHEPSNVCDF